MPTVYFYLNKQTDRQKNKRTDKQTETTGQTNKGTDEQTKRWTDARIKTERNLRELTITKFERSEQTRDKRRKAIVYH